MSFMQPEVWEEDHYEIETNCGTECVPVSVCGEWGDFDKDIDRDDWLESARRHFRDYLEGGEIYGVDRRSGWLCRMSAPGYLDCTDTASFDTEAEAIEYLLEMFGGESDEPEEWEQELQDRLAELRSAE